MELAQALVTSSRYSASARRYSASAIGALQPSAGRAPLSARPWPLSPRSRLMRGPVLAVVAAYSRMFEVLPIASSPIRS
jgi:hypothetical protein